MSGYFFDVFIIERFNIHLKVVIPSNRRVTIVPFNCKESNLRLWRSISHVQTMLAQAVLDKNNFSSSYNTLSAHFTKLGWNVSNVPES